MDTYLIDFFTKYGFSDFYAELCSIAILIIAIIAASFIIDIIAKRIILSIINKIVKKTKTKWDDILLDTGIFSRLAQVVPVLALYFYFPLIFQRAETAEIFIQRIILAYLIAIFIFAINSFLTAVNTIYSEYEISKNRPIKWISSDCSGCHCCNGHSFSYSNDS